MPGLCGSGGPRKQTDYYNHVLVLSAGHLGLVEMNECIIPDCENAVLICAIVGGVHMGGVNEERRNLVGREANDGW